MLKPMLSGKSFSSLFVFTIVAILFIFYGQSYSQPDAQEVLLAKMGALPFGYGQHTLGGCLNSGCKCEVTNLNDSGSGSLRSCVESDLPKWVVFGGGGRGIIKLQTPLLVGSNTTVDGRGPNAVTIQTSLGHIMYIADSSNIIISDLSFRVLLNARCSNPKRAADTMNCGGGISIVGASKNVWINQNLFESCGGKCVQAWTAGKTPDSQEGGDLITISGNLFRKSFYGALVGAAHDLKNNQIPTMRVTFYRNVFDNIDRRSPRASELSRVHALNNVVKNWGSDICHDAIAEAFAASSRSGAQLFLENNLFSARNSAQACKVATNIEGGFVRATGNVSENGAIIRQYGPTRVFDPHKVAPEYYDYTPEPMTAALEAYVERNVGPRLNVPVPDIP